MEEIREIQKQKRQAETEIAKILKELEAMTGLDVTAVTFERSGIVRGYSLPDISGVKIALVV